MINGLLVKGFKGFDPSDGGFQFLPLERVNIVFGPNGSGKSSLLDAIQAFQNILYGEDLSDALEATSRKRYRRAESGDVLGVSLGLTLNLQDPYAKHGVCDVKHSNPISPNYNAAVIHGLNAKPYEIGERVRWVETLSIAYGPITTIWEYRKNTDRWEYKNCEGSLAEVWAASFGENSSPDFIDQESAKRFWNKLHGYLQKAIVSTMEFGRMIIISAPQDNDDSDLDHFEKCAFEYFENLERALPNIGGMINNFYKTQIRIENLRSISWVDNVDQNQDQSKIDEIKLRKILFDDINLLGRVNAWMNKYLDCELQYSEDRIIYINDLLETEWCALKREDDNLDNSIFGELLGCISQIRYGAAGLDPDDEIFSEIIERIEMLKGLHPHDVTWDHIFELLENLDDWWRNQSHRSFDIIDASNRVCLSPSETGTGVSQCLPVLIAAMREEPGTVLVYQPELHLHPKLQGDLMDLILKRALLANSQGERSTWVLETHSEAMLIRLQRRIRETYEHRLPNDFPPICPGDVSVAYVQKEPCGVGEDDSEGEKAITESKINRLKKKTPAKADMFTNIMRGKTSRIINYPIDANGELTQDFPESFSDLRNRDRYSPEEFENWFNRQWSE